MISLNFSKSPDALLPAIVQDYKSGDVLMLAYINKLAWEKTLETGKAHYWSRSRNTLWLKGETSGHLQIIRNILVDCDEDTVVYKVEQLGNAACHTGHKTCFFRRVDNGELVVEGLSFTRFCFWSGFEIVGGYRNAASKYDKGKEELEQGRYNGPFFTFWCCLLFHVGKLSMMNS